MHSIRMNVGRVCLNYLTKQMYIILQTAREHEHIFLQTIITIDTANEVPTQCNHYYLDNKSLLKAHSPALKGKVNISLMGQISSFTNSKEQLATPDHLAITRWPAVTCYILKVVSPTPNTPA